MKKEEDYWKFIIKLTHLVNDMEKVKIAQGFLDFVEQENLVDPCPECERIKKIANNAEAQLKARVVN